MVILYILFFLVSIVSLYYSFYLFCRSSLTYTKMESGELRVLYSKISLVSSMSFGLILSCLVLNYLDSEPCGFRHGFLYISALSCVGSYAYIRWLLKVRGVSWANLVKDLDLKWFPLFG
jgi:hypothetical protein